MAALAPLAIEFCPHNSGTATALLGASGFAAGALAGSLVATLGNGSVRPIAILMFACYLCAPLLRYLLQRPRH